MKVCLVGLIAVVVVVIGFVYLNTFSIKVPGQGSYIYVLDIGDTNLVFKDWKVFSDSKGRVLFSYVDILSEYGQNVIFTIADEVLVITGFEEEFVDGAGRTEREIVQTVFLGGKGHLMTYDGVWWAITTPLGKGFLDGKLFNSEPIYQEIEGISYVIVDGSSYRL